MLSDDISVKILNVLLFRQGSTNERVSHRPFSALSFRISSGARFHTEEGVTEAKPGSICFLPADVAYRRESAGEELIVFHFNTDRAIEKKIQIHQPADPARYQALFVEAKEVWEAREPGYRYRATALFYEILASLERDGALRSLPRAQFLAAGEEFLRTYYADPDLTISDAARHCGVCDAYFRRAFRREWGVGPKQYLLSLRMHRAMALLNANEHSQTDIAGMTGFRDVKYFRAAFRAYTGMSLSAYRKNPEDVDGMRAYNEMINKI